MRLKIFQNKNKMKKMGMPMYAVMKAEAVKFPVVKTWNPLNMMTIEKKVREIHAR